MFGPIFVRLASDFNLERIIAIRSEKCIERRDKSVMFVYAASIALRVPNLIIHLLRFTYMYFYIMRRIETSDGLKNISAC